MSTVSSKSAAPPLNPSLVARFLLAALAIVALVGCASGTIHEPPEGTAAQDALMCPRCTAIWIQRPDRSDPYYLEYTSERAVICPDCRSAASTFFRTGRLEHTCTTCGDAPVHCTVSNER